jgi:hypothetical protein
VVVAWPYRSLIFFTSELSFDLKGDTMCDGVSRKRSYSYDITEKGFPSHVFMDSSSHVFMDSSSHAIMGSSHTEKKIWSIDEVRKVVDSDDLESFKHVLDSKLLIDFTGVSSEIGFLGPQDTTSLSHTHLCLITYTIIARAYKCISYMVSEGYSLGKVGNIYIMALPYVDFMKYYNLHREEFGTDVFKDFYLHICPDKFRFLHSVGIPYSPDTSYRLGLSLSYTENMQKMRREELQKSPNKEYEDRYVKAVVNTENVKECMDYYNSTKNGPQ